MAVDGHRTGLGFQPYRAEGGARSRKLTVRIKQVDLTAITRKALAAGLSPTEWLYRIVIRELEQGGAGG